MSKIKVMLVDDSALIRNVFEQVLAGSAEVELISTAQDPYFAVEKLKRAVPDVLILDIEMPRMDGLTFLKKIMEQNPMPVIICSTLAEQGTDSYFKALELGAVEIITKPKLGSKLFIEESKVQIVDKIKAAAACRGHLRKRTEIKKPQTKLTADVIIGRQRQALSMTRTTEKLVVIGASTGGTEAIRAILTQLPQDSPGILIVLHMPEHFTKSYANRLNQECNITVREATNNETILRGTALVAPGNQHMLLKRSGARYFVELRGGPLVSRHRPSVDVLFRSAAQYGGKNIVGVILTGMGDDGARGMSELHDEGAVTIAQDEQSCAVFGMPNEAIKRNAVDKVLPLGSIAEQLLLETHN
ncbi:chemotaxis response regulator protein-glutamate methylesterase [Teredinibacter sp. KSP-S5-2]|uniref:protein-glutamate methylesterase/protein-glutamine glutaminase n=1 Tax=Teredinibacter sp. KSP-S5-2 TaxID=3034506 RepID=UPI0029345A65|nr:chemotaxis response regulator protein-glutamate methylesterase [Teredinibacter sp. KSP-S5-2]WNO08157.1 chemotaxis response regulator protein-glutamate methylesterase [Teredinibacter sp. KSP-S5-2]